MYEMETYQHAKHARRGGCQTVPRAAILCGEYLCRYAVQHAVHYLPNGEHRRTENYHRGRTVLQNAKPQFHPRSSFDVLEVVLAYRNAPVSP